MEYIMTYNEYIKQKIINIYELKQKIGKLI